VGGPARSTVAKFVAEKGFDVLIVEKSRFPGEDNVCGGGRLSQKAFRVWRRRQYLREMDFKVDISSRGVSTIAE